jgi:predicted transcriptional regulator YdeE
MNAVQEKALPLTLEPEPIQFPSTHYAFIEKRGSIPANAPQAWTELHARLSAIAEHNQVTGYMSLYRIDEGIYRAGVALAAAPRQLPGGLAYENFGGGKYRKFVLHGPYSRLPEASMQAVKTAREGAMRLRNDFNIENYVNDPRTTPEEQLITEILFPVE